MIIHLDDENRIVAVDIYYDIEKEKDIKPIEINGIKTKFLIVKNDKLKNKILDVINNSFSNSSKIIDYIYNEENQDIVLSPIKSILDLQNDKKEKKENNCCKTVVVDIQNFKLNSDLRRHIEKINENDFDFKRVYVLPYHLLKKENIYSHDDLFYQELKGKDISDDDRIRIYGLFGKNSNQVAALCVFVFIEIFKMIALYWEVSDASYFLLNKVINEFKKEGLKFIDLGGLTKEDSGINQFKKKWGEVVRIVDLFLFK